jgi:ubiquinone/menaquinone biosynthesis C-methylase UbiE
VGRHDKVEHNRTGVRLGSYYRWLLTAALWPTESRATRILDVGCHSGFWLQQQTASSQKVGCDVAPVPLYDDIQYLRCDARRLPFPAGSFHLCTAWDVLEHVPDDQAMLKELSRVLQPSGRVRLSVPHKGIAVFPAFLMPWVQRRWDHTVRTGYTASEIESLARAAGFAGCRVIALKVPWFRCLYLPAALIWGVSQATGRRLGAALARGDAAAGQGPNGYLFAEMRKG